MLQNYLKIAVRNLLKHKVFSFINILGLSIGITCCVLLALFIKDEYSYEKHFAGHDHIYRVTTTITINGVDNKIPTVSPPIAMTMLDEFPELESATRLVSPLEVEQHLVRYQENTFYEKTGYLVDSTFFDIFSYPFETGDPLTALDGPSCVVLSYRMAHKIFDNRSPLDELITIESGTSVDTFRITGVLAPYVNRSQLNADFYMCMNSRGWGEFVMNNTMWSGQNFVSAFIKVNPAASLNELEAKFPGLLEKYGAEQLKELGMQKTLGLQPLADMHLYSAGQFTDAFDLGYLGPSGNITYLYILASIGFFILLIACINFMNLTTARASQRAGEVGIRKALGAHRVHLARQFMGESLTVTVLAMLLSVGLVQLFLPLFNQFTQRDLSINIHNAGYVVATLAGISLITGLIAGSYPAFFLSAFQPARVLKGKHLTGDSSNWLRKGLVIFQFFIAITLISAILIIHKQMNFIQDKSLGFNPEYRLTVPLRTTEAMEAYPRLRDRLQQMSGIKKVSAASALPSAKITRDLPLYTEGSSMEKAQIHYIINIDEDLFDLLDISMLAGRNLRYELDTFNFSKTTNHILVNKASLKATGLSIEEAVGSKLYIDWEGQRKEFVIEGVVEDFHQFSMHREVAPLVFHISAGNTDYAALCAAVDARGYENALAAIQATWKELVPNTPFEHSLLSDNIRRQYEADRRTLAIITAFTVIAILISCLGLYGLSIYMAERRVKEIGIRKVLGASVSGIVGMLSKDFIRMVGIAFVLSVPLGYYAMSKWLDSFAYKITPDVTTFIIAGAASFLVAWFTVGFESVKAAMNNPVDSLKSE